MNGSNPQIMVSWGDFIDKITILEIKSIKIKEGNAANNVAIELSYLQGKLKELVNLNQKSELVFFKESLYSINIELWEIEDLIREKESRKDFDYNFIELARRVYKTNDKRALIKKKINQLMNSALTEEKSYKSYD